MLLRLQRFPFLLATVLLPRNVSTTEENITEWYTKYPVYPDYCSTPGQMMTRGIPELEVDFETKVVHVTSILRHGARTIAKGRASDNQCWDGFWDDPATAVWDCGLTELLAPPDPARIVVEEEQGNGIFSQKSTFLFDKTYDALHGSDSNILNGTCQEGQMILEGYEQAVTNGMFLRAAYLDSDEGPEECMRLIDIDPASDLQPWDENNLYVRSDDSQQTLMSAQLLMRGMLEQELRYSREYGLHWNYGFPTIPVHTADHSRDILGGFQEHCDKLDAIQNAAETSQEYLDFIKEEESQQVRDFMKSQLAHDPGLFDCLMSTVCTDRPLPDRFGVYNPHPKSWFNRISAYHSKNHSFHLRYNDAEYSKLSMGPLWAEILDHITPVLNILTDTEDRVRPPAKLAVYSGYDSTIMQILSTLGPNVWDGAEWPPYASMVLIEIHELLDGTDLESFETDFAFRLIYNGIVLTDKVEGCPPDAVLCDAKILVDRVKSFANRSVDCIDPNAGMKDLHAMKVAKTLLTTTGGILLALAVAVASAIVGAVGVFFYLTGILPTNQVLRNSGLDDRGPTGGRKSSVSEGIEMSFTNASPYDDDNDNDID